MKTIRLLLFIAILTNTTSAFSEIFVLCYHSFLGKKNVDYDFSVEQLRSQLEYLRTNGFNFITFNDITIANVKGGKNILITIDDGNKSVYRAYMEVFKPMGIKPMLGIYPFIIGKKPYVLTWEQLKELSDDGCEIASHGYFHLKVNKKLYNEHRAYFNQEIYKSKKILEEKLGKRVDVFVHPFGLWSEITISTLKDAGYHYGFTIINGTLSVPISTVARPFELRRYMITRSLWESTFRHILALADRKENNRMKGKNLNVKKEFRNKKTADSLRIEDKVIRVDAQDVNYGAASGVVMSKWYSMSIDSINNYNSILSMMIKKTGDWWRIGFEEN